MTAAEQSVYIAIRDRIVNGVYPGGSHLRTETLATTLGVSRTPVRAALQRLHAEGIVVLIANRGAFVSSWSAADINDVFDIRILLESRAAKLAATNVSPEVLSTLSELADRMELAIKSKTPKQLDALTEHNAQFHRLIVEQAANRRLALVLGQVVQMPMVMRTFAIYSKDELARSMQHHRELIMAFEVADGDWAASVMQSHLQSAHHVLRRRADLLADNDAPSSKQDKPEKNPGRRGKRSKPHPSDKAGTK
jgi:DNA-binding GntR family transcriptional regulator